MKNYLVVFIIMFCCFCNSKKEKNSLVDYYKNADTSFFFMPLKDSFNKVDSFYKSQSHYYYNAFNEKNLSKNPTSEEVYRMYYSPSFDYTYVLTLKNKKLTIKKGIDGNLITYDTNKLSSIERLQYRLIPTFGYTINTNRAYTKQRLRVDSLVKLYPQLLDSNYKLQLLNKMLTYNIDTFKYSEKVKELTDIEYDEFKRKLTLANYWQLPFDSKCSVATNDGYGVILEANYNKKYKCVFYDDCFDLDKKYLINLVNYLLYISNIEKKYDDFDSVKPSKQIIVPEVFLENNIGK